MTGDQDCRDYLRDVLDAAKKARLFVENVDFQTFRTNTEKIFAVIRALEIIGEAANNIPRAVRQKYPNVPWKDMIDMRHKLIHRYFGVDLDVVWKTLQTDLPPMQEEVGRMLSEIQAENKKG